MSAPSSAGAEGFLQTPDFSLVLGGPLYQLWRGTRLAGDALQLLRRRIIVMALLAWAPLLLLSVAEGHAWGDAVTLPFLHDVELHVRLLIALPLLILAELVVHQRMRPVVAQFLERGLIPDAARAQFDAAIASAMRLRNSITAEVLLIAFVYVVGVGFIWRTQVALGRGELVRRAGGREIAAVAGRLVAGLRQPAAVPVPAPALVFPAVHLGALPVAGVAHRFAVHADASGSLRRPGLSRDGELRVRAGVGGPGGHAGRDDGQQDFLCGRQTARIQGGNHRDGGRDGVRRPRAACWCSVRNSQRPSARACGNTARWRSATCASSTTSGCAAARRPDEPLIGSADIQSLADLGNSFEVVKGMRWVPFTMQTVLQLAVATLVPVVPLMLTMISLEELLERLLKVVF